MIEKGACLCEKGNYEDNNTCNKCPNGCIACKDAKNCT